MWRVVVEIPFDPTQLDSGELHANMLMPYVSVGPPDEGTVDLDIDDFEIIEWRQASSMPPIPGAFTHVKNDNNSQRELKYRALVGD